MILQCFVYKRRHWSCPNQKFMKISLFVSGSWSIFSNWWQPACWLLFCQSSHLLSCHPRGRYTVLHLMVICVCVTGMGQLALASSVLPTHCLQFITKSPLPTHCQVTRHLQMANLLGGNSLEREPGRWANSWTQRRAAVAARGFPFSYTNPPLLPSSSGPKKPRTAAVSSGDAVATRDVPFSHTPITAAVSGLFGTEFGNSGSSMSGYVKMGRIWLPTLCTLPICLFACLSFWLPTGSCPPASWLCGVVLRQLGSCELTEVT